ncbi:lytic transglycosylase domain-containing protein [Marinilabiliaceae bacterium ANBcel2]|nr:lytic transglycosylase domain-containing protein [Marinilabiliaceae bacterium ANBcel2]
MENSKVKRGAFNLLSISTSVIAVVLVFNVFVQSSPADNIEEEIKEGDFFDNFKERYSIYALPMPDSLYFAGERVPLERTYVRESFDRELLVNTYWQSQTLLLIKRANRYFPVIEPILEDNDLPDDFKYLALIESGFMERVISPAGAVGIWQFLTGTARDYGLVVNNQVDERYHLEKSTVAAADYLKDSYERYDSWTMSAAAYNAGRRGMNRQIDRQKSDCYYELLLNEETSRYIFRILAIKEILNDPQKYGFNLTEKDLYPVIPTYDMEITETIDDIADFAQEHGATYKEVKDLNPWLRTTSLTVASGEKYIIKMPKEDAFKVNEKK